MTNVQNVGFPIILHSKTVILFSNQTVKGKGKGHHSHHPSHSGCFGLSSENMTDYWIFDGEAPSCSYVYYNMTDDGESDYEGYASDEDGGDNDEDGDGGDNDGDENENDGEDENNDVYEQGNEEQVVTQEEVADGQFDPYDDFILEKVSPEKRENIYRLDVTFCAHKYFLALLTTVWIHSAIRTKIFGFGISRFRVTIR